jgi:hypothetical protein
MLRIPPARCQVTFEIASDEGSAQNHRDILGEIRLRPELRKPKPLPDDPKQSKRFIDAAREIGTDESPAEFERVFKKITKARPRQATKATSRSSRGRE